MTSDRPLRTCVFAPVMQRHRGFYIPHSDLVANQMVRLGHDVVVLTGDVPEGGGAVDVECGKEIHYLAGTPASKGGERFWRDTAAVFDRMHAERPFDLVIGRGVSVWGYFKYSRFAKDVPVILHEGTYPAWLHQIEKRAGVLAPVLRCALAPIFALKNRARQFSLRSASCIVCNSSALAVAIRRSRWWNPPKTVAITYGFDTTLFAKGPVLPDQPPRLVSLGRMTWDKGIVQMIDVLARLSHNSATLEAIGPASDKVQKAVLDHALRLGVADRYSLPGPVNHQNVAARLAGATAFLFPSTHPEGLPKAVAEAMCAGLPVVAYRTPVLECLVDDGVTGFLVPLRSVSAMTDRVDQLLADPALAARMGAAARRKIEVEFNPEAVDDLWRKLLSEVLEEVAMRPGP